MSESNGVNPDDPTSVVGSNRANEITRENSDNNNQWRLLFEIQNEQMHALIQTLKTQPVNSKLVLPEFDTEKPESDALSWCATADLCFDGNVVEGSHLILTISKAMRGSASTWLSQITYPGMTWDQFKELFKARFVSVETSAATLINLSNDKPKDNETYAAYASRLMTFLMNRWKDMSVEQIAASTVIAHLAQIDTRLQRLAFTTEITTRHKLQQELQAFSYLKRRAPTDTRTDTGNEKRVKFSSLPPIKCHACGKLGHKQADCRTKKNDVKKPLPVPPASGAGQRQQASSSSLVCFKCGTPGHIASRCTASGSSAAVPVEKRVDLCIVEPPSGILKHFAVLLSLHAANTYILLTANLDDVHSLAKQLASSPVVDQVQDIISHASSIFNEHTENKAQYELGNKAQMRTDPKLDEDQPPTHRGQEKLDATENSQSNSQEGQEPMKKPDATPVHNVEVWTPDKEALSAELNAKMSDSSSESSGEANEIGGKPHRNMRRSGPDIAELGRNASFYLKSIKKIFEGF